MPRNYMTHSFLYKYELPKALPFNLIDFYSIFLVLFNYYLLVSVSVTYCLVSVQISSQIMLFLSDKQR